jgi:hypothetical protein
MNGIEASPPISRRKVMGLGFATGVALATGPTKNALGKAPSVRDLSPEFKAAFEFAVQKSFRSGMGYWAVIYPDDAFTGEPVLIGNPQLRPKPQAGAMPAGWGSATGSIVVGRSAVLRLFHRVNGQDAHITLLPYESMAQVGVIGIVDGKSTWKLYPAGDLRPPY